MAERQEALSPDREVAELRLARRLREAREYLGLSQDAVAQNLKIPRASISAIEAGKRKVSSMELRDLAHLYRTSVEALLGDSKEEDPVVQALFRTARNLTDEDRKQVLRFAQFLGTAGEAPESGR